MRHRVALDVGDLSPYSRGSMSTLWWGMLGLIMIEATVFSGLISSYFYLRAQATVWPPGANEPPELLLPTISTIVLIVSSVAVHWADRGIENDDRRRLSLGMLIAGVLGLAFLALKYIEYSGKAHQWDEDAYNSIVWTIVGFHSAHVIALLLKTLVVDTLAWRGYFTHIRRVGVTINGLYWHFVVAVWIPLYIVLYWVPRL